MFFFQGISYGVQKFFGPFDTSIGWKKMNSGKMNLNIFFANFFWPFKCDENTQNDVIKQAEIGFFENITMFLKLSADLNFGSK